MNATFQWYSDSQGGKIEEFIVLLCEAVPDVAKEILKVGFGDLRSWYDGADDNEWQTAKCGCLIGQSAIEATKLVDGCVALVDTHPNKDGYVRGDAPYILYMAICAATKRPIHQYASIESDPLFQTIEGVGMMVGDECVLRSILASSAEERERTQAVGQYLLDFIRSTLTLMGYKNLPNSPTKACNLKHSWRYA